LTGSFWWKEKIFKDFGHAYKVELVFEEQGLQKIQIFKNPNWGYFFVLDGIVQFTEKDEFIYHETITYLPASLLKYPPEKVIIIGGGDGGVLRELQKIPSIKEIIQFEIDTMVFNLCQKYFFRISGDYTDPRVHLFIRDGYEGLKKHRSESFDLIREKEVLNRILKMNKGMFPEDTLKIIYSEIIKACRSAQQKIKVAYLGPEATFSHIAALKYFGTSAELVPVETILDVFEEVSSERVNFGVVPIENSIEGVVATTLDAIYEYGLKVCGEIYESISHHLMNQTGRLEDVKKILSHPQAISQCRKWLRKKLPSVPIETVPSTALAAKWAAVDERVGAIASLMAAKLYHLQIVAKNIEDIKGNSTRFWIIGKQKIPPTGNDKTSLIFSVADRPGALYDVLKCFAQRKINLTKIESRPSKDEPWKYLFFLDCEGHIKDEKIKSCLEEMQNCCLQVIWLGSYPKGQQ